MSMFWERFVTNNLSAGCAAGRKMNYCLFGPCAVGRNTVGSEPFILCLFIFLHRCSGSNVSLALYNFYRMM